MVGIYTRGALAEAFAAALLPWLIWSLRRMLVRQTSSSLLLVGLLLSILLLSHSLTALLLRPFSGVYVTFEALHLPAAKQDQSIRPGRRNRDIGRVCFILLAAVCRRTRTLSGWEAGWAS